MLKKVSKQFLIVSHKQFLIVSLTILIGTIVWSLTMIRSGLLYDYGLGFWGANGHDGIWHLALSESLTRGTLENPVFAGEALKNYHLGFDLLVALINQVTKIPINYIYFQILPPLFALLIGVLVYWFVLNWRGSRSEALWAVLFTYFSSSFGFVVTYFRDRAITGESMFWSQQSVSTLINPPYALSLIFILAGLIALQKKKLILSILFFGVLLQVKAYAAVLVLGGLFVSGSYSYIINHKSYILKVFIGSLIINLILFLTFKNDNISVFVWQPFWFLENMMSYSDRLGWERFYSAMTTYKMGDIWFKGMIAYGVAFLIFIVGNMGLRILGFYLFFKAKLDYVSVFIGTVVAMGIIIPMFFVQQGTPWNTIQFFYYYLFFFSILAGVVASWLNKKFVFLFLVFAILGTWTTLQHYLPPKPQSIVSNLELEALNYLKNKPNGVVLTYLFDGYKAKEAKAPRSLYLYDSTAYVSAFSGKQSFEEDEVNLNIMGYNWQNRREEVLWFVSNLDPEAGKKFLESNNIKYLYLVKAISPIPGELLRLGSTELGLEKIFENNVSILYRYGEDFGSN